MQEPTDVAASAGDHWAFGQSQVQISISSTKVIQHPHGSVGAGARRRRGHDALHDEKAHDGPVSMSGTKPKAPVGVLGATRIQAPPFVAPAVGLRRGIVRAEDGGFTQARERTIHIEEVGRLRTARGARAETATVQTAVRMVALAGQAFHMSQAMFHGCVFEADLVGMEHALRFEDVAVRHVLDRHIVGPVVVAEGDVGQHRLHVRVVELEAISYFHEISCRVGSVGTDDRVVHVGVSQL